MELEREAFPDFQQSSIKSLKNGINSPFQESIIIESTTDTHQALGSLVLFKYKNTLRIYSIAIISEYRNKGIGGELIKYVKDLALKNYFHHITLEVRAKDERVIKWYQAKGFSISDRIKNYYHQDEDALKMNMNIDEKLLGKGNKNIIVIDQPYKWKKTDIKARIISVKEYINNTLYQSNSNFRIFNLCSSYRYQSLGYYVSLLASARSQRVIPNITTIRDIRIMNVIQSVASELDELINQLLIKVKSNTFSLDVYFGQTPLKGYKALASKLYQIFETPLFRVHFIKDEKWLIKSIKVLTYKGITAEEKELMYQFATNFFNKKRHNSVRLTHYIYDLAVLVNPNDENPPSGKEALEKFKLAANKKGVYLEFITKNDADKINEFDALFIRETTNVNHYTYELSRLAFAEGLVVIDDPWSILKCCNKIYQYELFKRNKLRTPDTIVLAKNVFTAKMLDDFNYPIVLKQPDSAFSLGVIKANNKQEAQEELTKLFKETDMVISQEFLYSNFDWRIGILDNRPIFACKYFMKKDHWQIYNWASDDEEKYGKSETIPVEQVPLEILQVAQKAASLIGDGLYGVDLKFVDGKVYVIEVNDNPNIDAGIEDLVLQEELYNIVIDSIINRIEVAKNICKLNLTNNNQPNANIINNNIIMREGLLSSGYQ